jgi:hypothetical protein
VAVVRYAGRRAISATLRLPSDVAVDAQGSLMIADSGNNAVRKVSISGVITTIAGGKGLGSSGDGAWSTGRWLSRDDAGEAG